MTSEAVVIGCACTNESCYLALSVSTIADTKRVAIIGNDAGFKEPVVILDAKGVETLRMALHDSQEERKEEKP